MTRLYLIRHAEAEGNVTMRFHGHYEGDITKKGEKQLLLLSDRFRDVNFDAVYSSDLLRAKKTALAVVGDRDMEINFRTELREIFGGEWENREWSYITQNYEKEFRRFNDEPHLCAIPGGETALGLQSRIKDKIFKLIKDNIGKKICVVSHGMAIKTFMCYIKGIDLANMRDQQWTWNASVNTLDFSKTGEVVSLEENDYSHLGEFATAFDKPRKNKKLD